MPLARPGGAQRRLLAEIGQEEQKRNLDLVLTEYRNYQNGIMPAGPGARDLVAFFTSVDGDLTELAGATAKTVGSDQEVRALLARRAGVLHFGVANYCWFIDPSKALCLKLAGTPHADKPLAGMCDSARCPQATHHLCHRPVWAEAANRAAVFIGYQHLAEEFERRLKAMQAAGEVPDLRNAQVARLKADNAALRRRIAERDTEIIAMAAFKKRALSRLAAQQDEIEQLRAAVIQPKNLRLMHAEQTARTIGPYS